MRVASVVFMMLLSFSAVAQSAPPVVGAEGNLSALVGSPTLVTIVLKGSGATDKNQRIVDVGADYFSVLGEDGERSAYLFSSVQEVRVQQGAVEEAKVNLEETSSLRVEEQRVLDRALARAKEIFDGANADQNLKMRAAMVLGATGSKEAVEYLEKLATSNDLETELDAYLNLYIAGSSDIPSDLLVNALKNNSRTLKAKGALLAGLSKSEPCVELLSEQINDRLVEISGPAAKALARLGRREIIPALFNMITELRDEKGDAAVFGLTTLGGDDVKAQAKSMLPKVTGQYRFRLVRVLYGLEDADAMRLLASEGLSDPGVALQSAVALAKRNDFAGRQYLSELLKNKYYDENEENLVKRGQASVALIAANDLTAVSHLQKLLSVNNAPARIRISMLMAELGKRKLIPVTQPLMENSDPKVAMEACLAVVAMARPQFRSRLTEVMK